MLLLDSSGLLHADFILLDLFPFNMQKCDLFALSMKNIDFQSLQLKKQNNREYQVLARMYTVSGTIKYCSYEKQYGDSSKT